ncbi:reverse transcriptase domain-containing protein [Tanacetum coccineum]
MGSNEETNAVEENILEMADTQAEIILSQGLPRHIFNNLNQTSTAKEIWDNVELLMQGSGRLSTRKEDLLIDLYSSQSLRASCQKDSQETGAVYNVIVDPGLCWLTPHSAPALSSPSTPSPQPTAQSPNDALMATMTQIANLLSGFQRCFQRKAPGNVGNTGARGKKVICYNCRGEGHVARQCKEPKRKMDYSYFKDKSFTVEAKEKGDVLDVAEHSSPDINMPTHTIPMLSKKPKAATADLHKDLLGTRNPGLGYMAKRAQPVLYDADTLFATTHHPLVLG